MNTNKTLSIKVKSKTNRGLDGEPEVEIITEWDLKKIIYAVIVIVVFILLPAYYFNLQDDNDTAQSIDVVRIKTGVKHPPQNSAKEVGTEQVPVPAIKARLSDKKSVEAILVEPAVQVVHDNPVVHIETEAKTLVIDKAEHSPQTHFPKTEPLNPHIARAQLARGINKLKPYGRIDFPFLVENSKTRGLYFFTEIIDMRGSTVFHEWLREGKSIYKRKMIIRGDRWRFYTSKLFTRTSVGQWQVRVITKQGEVLHKINFSVEKR